MRRALTFIGLSFAILLASCGTDDRESAEGEQDQAAAQPAAGKCYSFSGNSHCELGNATVAVNRSLSVTGLRAAGRDGVAVNLPDVTSFLPTGNYAPAAPSSTVIASSHSDGVVTSTMKVATTDRGTTFAATFTGNGQASTYTAIFSRNGQVLTRIANIPSGQPVPAALPPCWQCWVYRIILFRIRGIFNVAEASGACSWEQPFDPSRPPTVVLASGQSIVVDSIELREDISAGGSYPYTSFDRIDYTADNGSFGIIAEEVQ